MDILRKITTENYNIFFFIGKLKKQFWINLKLRNNMSEKADIASMMKGKRIIDRTYLFYNVRKTKQFKILLNESQVKRDHYGTSNSLYIYIILVWSICITQDKQLTIA